MPCTMPTIRFNRTKQNAELKKLGDLLTHELDKIREAFLSGDTPDFSGYDENWMHVLKNARAGYSQENSGPSEGVLTDAKLLAQVEELAAEYVFLRAAWRTDRGQSVKATIRRIQVEHRKEDLKRLAHTFIDSEDEVRLRKVLEADPAYPLQPQLGFDPDEF